MLRAVALFALIAFAEPGGPPPPAVPAAALALSEVPVARVEPAGSRSGPDRHPASPDLPPALAALVAGMALLAARARRIGDAGQHIRTALQDNLFSDVGHADLVAISRTLHQLDPGEANAVVAGLTDREIGVWMREVGGWNGGLSAAERDALFGNLAETLWPAQFLRLLDGGREKELMAAATAHAPPDVRARLALDLWESRTLEDPGWALIIDLASAASVAELEAAVARRSPDQVVVDLLGVVSTEHGERVTFDTLAAFTGLAARFEDPSQKAGLFVAAAGALAAHRRSRRSGSVTREAALGRLSTLLRSDPAGVIGRLNHGVDPHGNVLSAWIADMIAADRIDELDVVLAALLGGTDRLAFFADQGDDAAHPYANASNLGYYIGAYGLAIDALARDARERIDLVRRLFAMVAGVVPGPGGSRVRLPLGPLVDAHADSVIKELEARASSLQQALWDLAKPRSADGLIWNGPGTTQFQDAWEEVVLVR